MTDQTPFGDSEPEDAWQIDDPVDDLILNLERRLTLLDPRWTHYGTDSDARARVQHLIRCLDDVRRSRVDVDDDWRTDLLGRHLQVVLVRIGADNG